MANILGAIWAQTDKGIIGCNGTMPWNVPEDLKHFQRTTVGKPVIMGRRTWESLPETYKPLPGRVNIIISRSVSGVEYRNGGIWVSSLDAALEEAYRTVENRETASDGLSVEPDQLTRGKPEREAPDYEEGTEASEPAEQETEPEQGTGSTDAEEETVNEPAEPEPTHADAWIIGGGTLYAEALTHNNLPHYKHVSIIERTILTAIDGTVIPGDTKAPALTGEAKDNSDTVHPAQTTWETVSEQPLRVSESGYLLDEHGEMCPAVYMFQTLTRAPL